MLSRRAIRVGRRSEPRVRRHCFGAQILARDIQDVQTNVTRFVVLGMHDPEPTGDDKTSIAFHGETGRAGALFKVMKPLAERGIQLTKIESRPSKSRIWAITSS